MSLPEVLANSLNLALESAPTAPLAAAVEALSASYGAGAEPTKARAQAAFDAPLSRLAYLATRMPATYAAIASAIAAAAEALPGFAPSSQLDLGAGPATAAWAALDSFPSLSQITCIEQDAELAQWGRRLSEEAPKALREAEWRIGEARKTLRAAPVERRWELVSLGYLLNELADDEALTLAREAWRRCSGLMIVVEPGTPRAFARLSALRAEMLAQDAALAAPCPSAGACPARAAGDWCHFAERLERSRLHRRLKGGELGYEDEKYSYLALSRASCEPALARLVRHPQKLTGHVKLQLCDGERLRGLAVGKSKKELYRAAKKMTWGDALRGEEWRELLATTPRR